MSAALKGPYILREVYKVKVALMRKNIEETRCAIVSWRTRRWCITRFHDGENLTLTFSSRAITLKNGVRISVKITRSCLSSQCNGKL